MDFFDFHHHHPHRATGIFNVNIWDEAPEIKFSAGIHPQDAEENMEAKFTWLKEISQNKNCFAIGECGLDGLVSVDDRVQEAYFENQIILANDLQKPLIIHCVRRFSKILKFKKLARTPMIIHGFNKKEHIAKEMLQHGFYLSFGKALLQNVSLQSVLKDFPLDKLFLESDAADFPMEILYQKVSEIKNMSEEDLQSQIYQNLENIRRNE